MASITSPVTVVAQPYDISGNGGRKLVRLSNGWLIAAAWRTAVPNVIYLYKSTDNGATWTQLCNISQTGIDIKNPCLVAFGTRVHVLFYSFGSSNEVRSVSLDATTQSNTNVYAQSKVVDIQTEFAGLSLEIRSTGTELHAAWASKNVTYPNNFNIRYSKGTIDGSGNVTWQAPTQVTIQNGGSPNDVVYPCIAVDPAGVPFIVAQYAGNQSYIILFTTKFTTKNGLSVGHANWGSQYVFNGGNDHQYNQCVVIDNNGVMHVVWQGKDSTDNVVYNIRYSKSSDGGATWANSTKLTSGNSTDCMNPSLSVNKNNKLFVIYEYASWLYEVDFVTSWTSPFQVTQSLYLFNPSTLYDSKLDFSSPLLVAKSTSESALKFRGVWVTNQNPTLSLTSPANNQTLAEGNSYAVEGNASDSDSGNVMTVKYKINNGTARALASGVSDGSSPLSFAKTLKYSNKRVWDGATDVSGVDLAENVDHFLTVWSEDDQGGKSAEVTRKFRVIWNRPPTISDTNRDLGVIEEAPSINYTVTDPETNAFTVTEKINGSTIRSFAGVAGRQETVTIPLDTWLRLEPGVLHTLTIEATDNQGMTSSRAYTLTRFVDKIIFNGMDFSALAEEIKAKFTTDVAAQRLLLTPVWDMPPGVTLLVEVCNNAYDAEPAWEDATVEVKLNRAHLFSNTTKTAEQWGINFRFVIEKGTAIAPVYFRGVGGAFD